MPRGSLDARDYHERIFTRGGGRFAKCPKIEKRYRGTLGDEFFFLFPKNMDGEEICGTLEMLLDCVWLRVD
jgi:hypothetical protein